MCVIMCKPMGVAYPPREEIVECCLNNPDGFGAMWNTPSGKVAIYKTMKKDDFLRWYDNFVKKHPVSTALVCHMRIATHGSKKAQNCHPWTDVTKSVGFAHNGILTIDNRGDLTDSETFFRDLWLPAWKVGGRKGADRAVEACIGTSKFCFLYGNGEVEMWGTWQDGSVEGVKYTNASWQSYKIIRPASCNSGSMTDWYRQYGYWDWDDDDYDSYDVPKKPTSDERLKWIMEWKRIDDLRKIYQEHQSELPFKYRSMSFDDAMATLVAMSSSTWMSPLHELFGYYGISWKNLTKEESECVVNFNSDYYNRF